MSGIVVTLISYLRKYNVWFLPIMIILQGFGIPTFPSVLVMASGAFAYQGEFNVIFLFLRVWLFIIAADTATYWAWRWFGEYLFNKYKRMKNYFKPKLHTAELYLEKRGKLAVFLTRFAVCAMSPLVNAVAGLSEYSFFQFISIAAAGDVIWTSIYVGLGYWFGDSWEEAASIVSKFGQLITLVLALIVMIYIAKKWVFIKMVENRKNQ